MDEGLFSTQDFLGREVWDRSLLDVHPTSNRGEGGSGVAPGTERPTSRVTTGWWGLDQWSKRRSSNGPGLGLRRTLGPETGLRVPVSLSHVYHLTKQSKI